MAQQIGYLFDPGLQQAANRRGEIYWYRYVEEVLDQLGVRAEALPFAAVDERRLGEFRVLVLGDYDAASLAAGRIEAWVKSGGILIGFATRGLDGLFGVRATGPDVSPPPFILAGWMDLAGQGEAAGLIDPLYPTSDCPLFAAFRQVEPAGSERLLALRQAKESPPASAALTRRTLGAGRAFYFAFNLPQAVWSLHRGRPIDKDVDGDNVLRTSDAVLLPAGPTITVPWCDLLVQILENMIAPTAMPFLHSLPPVDGKVPDAVFHTGGDDEAEDGLQARMSEAMKALGLPYHVNVMLGFDGEFHFSDQDMALYEANGHEVSQHFNFRGFPLGVTHPAPIDEAEYDRQISLFVKRYGKTPVCANFHCLRASGWADGARFGARHGILGENNLIHYPSPPGNPTNLFGCPFGTVYPHFVYEDPAHAHERLKFVTLPIGFYEPGALPDGASHPLIGKDAYQPEEYRRVVDLACRHDWTLNVFLHPQHLLNPKAKVKEAIRCMLDRVAETGRKVVWVGNDALCLWWHARSQTKISGDSGTYTVETSHPAGVLVRFLADSLPKGARIEVDGKTAQTELREREGKRWVFIHLPKGEHRLTRGS